MLLFISLSFIFLLSEFFIRKLYPQSLQRYWVIHEPEYGLIVNKKNHLYKMHRFNEFQAKYKFGEFGNRITVDSDTFNKLETKPNILILGDSFTFGWLLKDHNTFVHKLQIDNLDFNFINSSVGAWGTAHFAAFTELYCKKIKPKKIIVFLNTDDFYRGWASKLYKSEDDILKLNKLESSPINSELSSFDKKIPFYKILKKNSHLFMLLRNKVYDLINPPSYAPANRSLYYPTTNITFTKKNILDINNFNKKIFVNLKKQANQCGADLFIIYNGWAKISDMDKLNPNKFFLKKAEEYFNNNKITYFDNSKNMANLYKDPMKYIINIDFHPNDKGAELIYIGVRDNIKKFILN